MIVELKDNIAVISNNRVKKASWPKYANKKFTSIASEIKELQTGFIKLTNGDESFSLEEVKEWIDDLYEKLRSNIIKANSAGLINVTYETK